MSMLGKMLGFHRNEDYDRGIRLFDQGIYEEAIRAFSKAREPRRGRKDEMTDRLASVLFGGSVFASGPCRDEARTVGTGGRPFSLGAGH